MQATGRRERTVTGSPQGGIASPLLANIALTALDRLYEAAWRQMNRHASYRQVLRRRGFPTYRLARYAVFALRLPLQLQPSRHRPARATPVPLRTRAIRPLRRGVASLTLVGLIAAAPAAAQAGPTVLVTQAAPTSVTAFRGLALWSAWDPEARIYRLVGSRHGGPVFALPVPPRRVPFDVDLGPDRRGHPVAVYSRCRREPPRQGEYRTIQVGLPEYARARECDVWRYRFADKAEQRVRGASRDGVSEYLPSIWRNRLVFGRIDSRLPRFRGVQPRLAVMRLGGGRRLRLLRGGRTGFYDSPNPRTNSTVGGPGPSRIDIYGNRIAWTWESLAEACENNDEPGKDLPIVTELFLQRLGGSRQRLRIGCSSDPINFMQSPSFAAGKLSWVTAGQPDGAAPPRRFETLELATGQITAVPAASCLSAMVRSTDAIYTSRKLTCPFAQPGQRPLYEVTRSTPDS